MEHVTETHLPGVGDRYDLTLHEGRNIGVIAHKTGRRELLIFDREDPDACRETVRLDEDEGHALADLLGGTTVAERAHESPLRVEGLTLDWMRLRDDAPAAGKTLEETNLRRETGAFVVAIMRGGETIPAPRGDERLQAGDVAVVIGPVEALAAAETLLTRSGPGG